MRWRAMGLHPGDDGMRAALVRMTVAHCLHMQGRGWSRDRAQGWIDRLYTRAIAIVLGLRREGE